jgi:hypothetical protein
VFLSIGHWNILVLRAHTWLSASANIRLGLTGQNIVLFALEENEEEIKFYGKILQNFLG